MLPVTELRGAIPFFLVTHPELPKLLIVGIAIIGNTIPNFFILWILPKLEDWLHNFTRTKNLVHWFTTKIRERHSTKFKRYGTLAILLVGSLPIPGTGSYTTAVLASLFKVPYWKSMKLLFLGNIIAASIVTAFATGLIHISGF